MRYPYSSAEAVICFPILNRQWTTKMYFSIFNTHFSKTPCRPTIAGLYVSLTKEQLIIYKPWALATLVPLLQICCGIHAPFKGYFKELVSETYNIRKHWKHIQPMEYSGLSRKHKFSRKQNLTTACWLNECFILIKTKMQNMVTLQYWFYHILLW